MPPLLNVLVDFDNLLDHCRGWSIQAISRHLDSRIPLEFIDGYNSVNFRLYGGWVEGARLTRQAQLLVPELMKDFPFTSSRVQLDGTTKQLIFNAEIVQSALCLPSAALPDLFMPRRSVRNLVVDADGWRGCASPRSCALNCVEPFLQTGACINSACSVSTEDLLKRNEQKQVDTLLVVDAATLAFRDRAKHLVIVSSDLDMWPAVILCLTQGTAVCHVHTKAGVRTKAAQTQTLSKLTTQYVDLSV